MSELRDRLERLAARGRARGADDVLGAAMRGVPLEPVERDAILENFGDRLCFPADFVGRGDMSRGGLLLRCAQDREELRYISVAGAVLNGKRPPKLAPRRYPKGWPSQ